MRAEFWITQTFNGLSYGALLFLLASGLSLIFGVMRIVNLAHGSYFLLGGYIGLSVIWRTGSFPWPCWAGRWRSRSSASAWSGSSCAAWPTRPSARC